MPEPNDTHPDAGARRPLILVAPRLEDPNLALNLPERLAPEEAAATVFMDAILAAGGLPLIMPLTEDPSVVDAYIAMADGIAVPGGQDVDPALWGVEEPYDEKLLCRERDAFELVLIRRALEERIPLFTTCRGTQILNVALGGTLCMDVPGMEPAPGTVLWRHQLILNDPAHPVVVEDGSLLQRSLGGRAHIQVNSSHHCCVARLGEGVVLSGAATDGVPEAIEVPEQPFCLGVQWHPEYTWRTMESDFSLWRAFVSAAARRKAASGAHSQG